MAQKYDFFTGILSGFLDALDIRATHLVAHDLGGPVGLYWAVENPSRVRDIVLLNTMVYPETSWAVKLFLLALRTPVLRDYLLSPKGIVGILQFGGTRAERVVPDFARRNQWFAENSSMAAFF